MAKQILVSVRSEDELGEIIPYLERIIKPGMKIVFLVHSTRNVSVSDKDCASLPQAFDPEIKPAQPRTEPSLDPQHETRLTEARVLAACRTLLNAGFGIGVEVYSRSLTRTIGKYTARGGVDVLVMPAGISLKILKFLHAKFSFRRLFQTTPASPLFVSYSQASGASQPNTPGTDEKEPLWPRTWMPDPSKVLPREASR